MSFLYPARRDVIKSLIANPPRTVESVNAAIQAYQLSMTEIQAALICGRAEQEEVMDDITLLGVLWGVIETALEDGNAVLQMQIENPLAYHPGNQTIH